MHTVDIQEQDIQEEGRKGRRKEGRKERRIDGRIDRREEGRERKVIAKINSILLHSFRKNKKFPPTSVLLVI